MGGVQGELTVFPGTYKQSTRQCRFSLARGTTREHITTMTTTQDTRTETPWTDQYAAALREIDERFERGEINALEARQEEAEAAYAFHQD